MNGIVQEALRQRSFLNPRVILNFRVGVTADGRDDGGSAQLTTWRYPDGLRDCVRHINRTLTPIHPDIVHFSGVADGLQVEVALQWTMSTAPEAVTFVNGFVIRRWSHVDGVLCGIMSLLNSGASHRRLIGSVDLELRDVSERLTSVIRIDTRNQRGQVPLDIAEIDSFLASITERHLAGWLDRNPDSAELIVKFAIDARRARLEDYTSHCNAYC